MIALALLTSLGACRPSPQQIADGEDPLAALTVLVESKRYNTGYWREQARTDSAGRWAKAVAYCGDGRPRPGLEADGAKPNCAAVYGAEFEVANERSMRTLRARTDAVEARNRRMQRDPAYRKYIMDSVYNANKF